MAVADDDSVLSDHALYAEPDKVAFDDAILNDGATITSSLDDYVQECRSYLVNFSM